MNDGYSDKKTVIIPQESLPISREVDVVVVGGGPTGIAAAVSASRNGAKTLIIEQRGYFGGMATVSLVPAFCPYTDGEKPIIRGIGLEILEKMKSLAGERFYERFQTRLDWVPIDSEALKRVYDQLVNESGCESLFYSFVGQVLVNESGDGIDGIVVVNKSGRSVVHAKTYIDATGDGDLAALSGVPFHKGSQDGELQPGTMCYLLTNADQDKFIKYVKETGDTDQIPMAVEKAMNNGDLPPGRKSVSGFSWISPTLVGVNFGHIFHVDGTKAEALTSAAIEGRNLVQTQLNFLKNYVPGFEDVHLVQTGEQVGIRETRRIIGDYQLTVDDFQNMRSFDDDIARNAYFIDVHLANAKSKMNIQHLPKGKSHGVPYRVMLPKGKNNLIVAGRSASTDRVVQGSLRVMPNCFAMGQAAGTAASLAASASFGFRDVPIKQLQEILRKQDAYLG